MHSAQWVTFRRFSALYFGLRVFEQPQNILTVSTAIDLVWGRDGSPFSGSKEAPGKSITAPMSSLGRRFHERGRLNARSAGARRHKLHERSPSGLVPFRLGQYDRHRED